MSKRTINEPIIYRLMCMYKHMVNNCHQDFLSFQEAVDYTNSMNTKGIEWYGIYEINPGLKFLKRLISKRLLPYDDHIPTKKVTISETEQKQRRRRKQIT